MLCTDCVHIRTERTGPHETLSHCAQHRAEFPNAWRCADYRPRATDHPPPEWPLDSDGWEWARRSFIGDR
jgi:hypothetical protein